MYVDDGIFAPAARALLPDVYSPAKGIYHYRSMAKTNYRGYLNEDTVPLKKYFYVLRPLLSIKWLEKFQTPAPIEFHLLRELLTEFPQVNEEIEFLLERKKQSMEKELAPAIPALNQFIEDTLSYYEEHKPVEVDTNQDIERLNRLFQKFLTE